MSCGRNDFNFYSVIVGCTSAATSVDQQDFNSRPQCSTIERVYMSGNIHNHDWLSASILRFISSLRLRNRKKACNTSKCFLGVKALYKKSRGLLLGLLEYSCD